MGIYAIESGAWVLGGTGVYQASRINISLIDQVCNLTVIRRNLRGPGRWVPARCQNKSKLGHGAGLALPCPAAVARELICCAL